jgi:Family of unknown function (DUF5709)
MSQQDGRGDGLAEWDDVEDEGVLDRSDTLDDNRVGDPLDTGVGAADHWSGANRFGTTAAEQRAGQSLAQKLAEEDPDLDPNAEDGDDEDELTRRGYERDRRAGRLSADDRGFGPVRDDSLAWDVGVDGGGASAEEAAVHVVEDPDSPGAGPLR